MLLEGQVHTCGGDTLLLEKRNISPEMHHIIMLSGSKVYILLIRIRKTPDEEVLTLIQNRIICQIPDEKVSSELHHLVT